jgi:hypothetical protein
MKLTARILAPASALLLSVACGGEDITAPPGGGGNTQPYSTANKINAHLDGKTMTMEGAALPSHSNGFDENVNFGQATQCYNSVVMRALGGKWTVTSKLGTLNGAPNTGDQGTCDRATVSAELTFDSTAVIVENVQGNGECFDFNITYAGFAQEGRGALSADGKTLRLELFFKDQAIGHRCADGKPGDRTVTLNMNAFTGDAVQVYTITE